MMAPLRRQAGMALLVTLVLIALMALMAFSGSENIRLQQRLASNDQAAQIAFQAAEAALKEAVEQILGAPQLASFCKGKANRPTIDSLATLNSDDVLQSLADHGTDVDFTVGDNNGEHLPLGTQPRYVITCVDEGAIEDYIPPQSMVEGKNETAVGEYHFFRIYAQGFGPRGQLSRVIEARYVF
ncbi:PilX N-terminal domain-containing pilus assembly protein [Halomonas sp. HP20-15]|uniref:pilus assembly PilX family protein n=1 Tax=Halomonas sp. HP20-15 TaxID=3085901 RepID=UPI0029826F0D|nr:PilX N-terminal domain-containing pilus assembly protein [Halomonas sp. HP20-15]MDW5376194.1 PilX N-terminal domain-containing pilus assembly protein [Halomonas sp. HP20-15]